MPVNYLQDPADGAFRKMACDARYWSLDDGFEFSCDESSGHTGPHRSEEYDQERDNFRMAEWGNASA